MITTVRMVWAITGILTVTTGPISGAYADIYRFVTIDGVETFTDVPSNKDAKVAIRETVPAPARGRMKKARKTETVSLNEILDRTVAAHRATSEVPSQLQMTLPFHGGTVTSGVGMRIDPIDGRLRHHNGIDIALPEGTPITPVEPGVIVYSGFRTGYGNTVLVEHDNGMITLYAHNSRLVADQGQRVDQGATIALSGNTGRSTGPHLHFEAWQNGINVSNAYLTDGSGRPASVGAAPARAVPAFRREILADGSILFTNLPSSARQ